MTVQFSIFEESTGRYCVMLQNRDGQAYAGNLSARGYATRQAAEEAIADGSAAALIIAGAMRENEAHDRALLHRLRAASCPGTKRHPDLSWIWRVDLDTVRAELARAARPAL